MPFKQEYVSSMPPIHNFPLWSRVFGPSTHRITKAMVDDLKILLCESWGCDYEAKVLERKAAAASLWPHLRPRDCDSVGGLISRLLETHVDKNHLKQLPPAFRYLPRDYHVGPMCVMAGGGGEDWLHYDINKAYLWAMETNMPLCKTYRRVHTSTLGKWVTQGRKLDGFFSGTLWIPKCGRMQETLNIGPLPQRIKIPIQIGDVEVFRVHTVWPTGYVTGEWPLFLVMNAVRNYGAQVIEVVDGYTCSSVTGVFNRYLEEIHRATEVDTGLFKLLYQRAWTKFRPTAWVEGQKIENKKRLPNGDFVTVERYKWHRPLIDWTSNRWPPGKRMRPDITAYIAGRVIERMVNAINFAGPGCVSFAHIDSLHVSSFGGLREPTGSRYGDFRLDKGPSPARFYSPGVYEYKQSADAYFGESEAPEMPISEVVPHTRDWHPGYDGNPSNPATDQFATSDPLHYTKRKEPALPLQALTRRDECNRHRSSHDPSFNSKGWLEEGSGDDS